MTQSKSQQPFLEVKNLNVAFPTEDGLVKASSDISFSVARGETLAVVGESGSGKSVTSLAVMGLHNRKSAQISGQAILNMDSGPVDVISADEETVRKLRGKAMSMIFQDPMSALHPYYSIGNQLVEAWSLYNEGSPEDGKKRAIEMLDLVGIPAATKRVDEYPHQFSGGMRQRVMIAIAISCNPQLLIADEPTTARPSSPGPACRRRPPTPMSTTPPSGRSGTSSARAPIVKAAIGAISRVLRQSCRGTARKANSPALLPVRDVRIWKPCTRHRGNASRIAYRCFKVELTLWRGRGSGRRDRGDQGAAPPHSRLLGGRDYEAWTVPESFFFYLSVF